MMQTVEFECAQCGAHVHSFGIREAPASRLCATCQWIADLPPTHRQSSAEFIYRDDPEALRIWRAAQPAEPEPPAFVCPFCARPSWSKQDAEHRYCKVCGFVDEPFDREGRPRADGPPGREPPA